MWYIFTSIEVQEVLDVKNDYFAISGSSVRNALDNIQKITGVNTFGWGLNKQYSSEDLAKAIGELVGHVNAIHRKNNSSFLMSTADVYVLKAKANKMPDGSNGMTCQKCNQYYPYVAIGNMPDGTLKCYSCRNGF